MEMVVIFSLEMSCDFYARIVLACRRWPLLLNWLVFAQPEVEDPERQRCAEDLLDMKFKDLLVMDFTSAKIPTFAESSLQ